MIGLGAMVIVIASTFLPMLSANSELTGFMKGLGEELQKQSSLWKADDDSSSTVAILIVVLAGIMGLFSLLSNKKHLFSIGTLLFSGLLLLISMKWFRDLREGKELIAMGTGLILFLAGSALGFVSSILGFMKK